MHTTKILAINIFIVMIPIMAIAYTTMINSDIQNNNYDMITMVAYA
jgi:hypothetical protein